MKNTSGLWLTALFVLLMLGFGSAAEAQTLSVSVTSDGTQSITAGSSFSNGGTLTITASGVPAGATVSISSVTLSVGNADIFDALTLNGSAPGGSSNASVPLSSGTNAANFSSLQLSNGQSATFTLNGTVSSTPPANTLGLRHVNNVRLASMFALGPAGAATMVLLGLLTLAVLALSGKLRRRHIFMFAVWLLMTAAVAGCGNGGSASSDQQVTAVSATSSTGSTVNVTGVPADMGTITLELDQTTNLVAPTPTPVL